MMRICIALCAVLVCGSFILADASEEEKLRFIGKAIDLAKEKAQASKDVLIVMENKTQAILIFTKGKFQGVFCQVSQRKLGLGIAEMEFILLDKENAKVLDIKNPGRYQSCYANLENITLKKDSFRLKRAVNISNNSEFFDAFYKGEEKKGTKSILLDLRIYDYREKKR